jgi:phospholipid/cholesterol/gamma-HCH transport system ATP-binding protein
VAVVERRKVKIRLQDLHKAFGPNVVLDGIDLDIFEGESLAIIGGSGTGKSVLLKHMIGLLRPDSGRVEVDGVVLNELSYREIATFRRRFGMAFQEGALFDSMTVRDNIAFPLTRERRHSREEIGRRVAECLEEVGLTEAADKMPSELSGGMRRRVGFARAVAAKPDILLFDEPTTGLDPVTKETIDTLIVELSERLGSTTITISHDMVSVFRIADRVAMLFDGKLIAVAPPEEFRRLDDPRVRRFLRADTQPATV